MIVVCRALRKPLRATALALASAEFGEIILLGSIATGKYTDTLLPVFGERLRYPSNPRRRAEDDEPWRPLVTCDCRKRELR